MDNPTPSRSSATESRGYRRRSRPARTKAKAAAAANDGEQTSFRRRPKISTPKASPGDESIAIPFPVPSILTTRWLVRTAPIVLAQHLVYARGMWPMSVPQLLLLQQQDKTVLESRSTDGLPKDNRSGHDARNLQSNKRQRLNRASRTNPSLRRKQQRAADQIERLCGEWAQYTAATSHSIDNHNANGQNEQQNDHTELPKFLLVLVGPSYTRGRELFLLDFQSLIDGDETTIDLAKDDGNKTFTLEQEEKYKAMLARKLVSALMKHGSDEERPSIVNSLPAPTSPSFRLWFTAGFENRCARNKFADAAEHATSVDIDNSGCIPSTTCRDDDILAHTTEAAVAPASSTLSWIPRTKFPFSKQKPQSRSSVRKQSLITIRFFRNRKQSPPIQEQHTSIIASSNITEDARSNHIASDPNLLGPTSEQLKWMSLSTHVKGFRL